eukprot:s552_g13.t1
MAAASDDSAPSWVGLRARIGTNLVTIRWGPGVLQAPAKPGEAGYTDQTNKPESVEVVGVEYDEASRSSRSALKMSMSCIQQVLAAGIAVLITVLDNFPYGFLVFPMAHELHGVGVSMVLLSAAVAQAVFSCSSNLPEGLGCMIVENIPMLHSMALSVTTSLAERPDMILPTTLALYATASLATAIAFLLLGFFELERVFMILPKPVLMGCIGGMGIYIVAAGVEASTGISWAWSKAVFLDQAMQWPKILVLLVLELFLLNCLRLARGRDWEFFVLPLFFLGLVPASWMALSMAGYSRELAQEDGWIFNDFPMLTTYHFQMLRVDLIAWDVFPYQLPLLMGIVIFSCLHVPVNVPALAQATGREVDVNRELAAHGIANLIAACLGTLQNYMVYSSSLLYFKCGGGSRITGFIVSLVVLMIIPLASTVISFLPRVLAGVLLSHLGVELVWEALVDTWPTLDVLEYIIAVSIACICTISFIYGLLIGLLCACIAFAVQAARSDPVRFAFYPGRGVRSRKFRSQLELQILEDFDNRGGFMVLRLHGVLFFGNTHSLPKRVQDIQCKALILDFAQVVSIDSSAYSQLNALATNLHSKGMELLCSGLQHAAMHKVQRYPQLHAASFFSDMDSAVQRVEEIVLTPSVSAPPPSLPRTCSARRAAPWAAEASEADKVFFDEVCSCLLEPLGLPQPETSRALRSFFEFQRSGEGTVLWNPGDPSDFAFLLVSGHVGVLDDYCDRVGTESGRNFVECSVRGQFTGELNLFTGESRKNRVVATEDLSMWTVTRASLLRMQQDALPLAFALQGIVLRYAAHRMYLSMLDGHEGLGKHSGTYQGKTLFTCRDGHGSFAKVEKLELGMPIQRAIAEKYFAAALPEAAKKSTRQETLDAMDYMDSKGREKSMSVEFVGRYDIEQRQQRLEGFVEMSLAESALVSRYPDEIWSGDWSLPNLKSLWLDKTLICEWAEVAAICELCPNLEWLSLSRTRLRACQPGALPAPAHAPNGMSDRLVFKPFVCKVRTLILNGTGITWSDLLAVDALGLFPQLEHLHLSQNSLEEGIPTILGDAEGNDDAPVRRLQRLQSLVLDNNHISDWTVLRRAIAAFPSLQALHLNGNLLGESIEGLAQAAADQTPRRLTALFLNENKLASWRSIGALASYALLELKVQRIPLTDSGSPLASPMLLRQVLIALMPTLMRLNASEVTVKERTAAERYFLSIAHQTDSLLVQGLAESCNIQEHVERLRAIHGAVVGGDITEHSQASRSALSNALVEVALRPVGAAIVEKPVTRKKVPHTMTVGELKRLAQLLFKQVPLDRVMLTLADDGLPFGVPLDDEARELGFFGIGDGAEIRVDDSADIPPPKT